MRFWQLVFAGALLVGPASATVISISRTSATAPWGVPGNGTIGQTITAPADSQLLDFTFLLGPQYAGSGSISYRAYVIEWDNTNLRTTGPILYTSDINTYSPPASGFTPVTFTPNITLTPSSRYFLAISTTGLTAGAPSSTIAVGTNNSNPYSGGQVFFTAQAANLWQSITWGALPVSDLAGTVNFANTAIPEPSTNALSGIALASLGLLLHKRKAIG